MGLVCRQCECADGLLQGPGRQGLRPARHGQQQAAVEAAGARTARHLLRGRQQQVHAFAGKLKNVWLFLHPEEFNGHIFISNFFSLYLKKQFKSDLLKDPK